MKKDVIWALIIGLTIGALIAVLAVRLPVLFEKKPDTGNTVKKDSPTPTNAVEVKTVFSVDSPPQNAILEKNQIKITGKAPEDTPIVIEMENDAFVVESDKNGEYSASVSLAEGGNVIYITSVDSAGNNITKSLNLFYTTEKL